MEVINANEGGLETSSYKDLIWDLKRVRIYVVGKVGRVHPSLRKQLRRHENECHTREAASSTTWLENGPERWEMIPKSRLELSWTKKVLVLTK